MGTLLLVHAHPDDECMATGGVTLRAHLDGHRVVLVTATGGEEGEIHNMDEAAVRPRLAEVRAAELRRSCEILGVDRQVPLGYRDSGMAGTPANGDPRSFNAAPLEQTAERVAAVLREERPDVIVTYTPDGGYGHPDHIRAHRATMAAVDALEREGWRPDGVFLAAIPRSFARGIGELAKAAGIDLPDGFGRIPGVPDDEITTVVDVSDLVDRKVASMAAHVSQVDPNSPFASLPPHVFEALFGAERFVRVRGEPGPERPEPSLFRAR